MSHSRALAMLVGMSDDIADEVLASIKWPEGPVCPRCQWTKYWNIDERRLFRCTACSAEFSITSGTILASSKMASRELMAAAFLFSRSRKASSNAAAKLLLFQQKTIWVLFHKFREALARELELPASYRGLYDAERRWKAATTKTGTTKRTAELLSIALNSPNSRCMAGYWQFGAAA